MTLAQRLQKTIHSVTNKSCSLNKATKIANIILTSDQGDMVFKDFYVEWCNYMKGNRICRNWSVAPKKGA